MFVRSEIVLDFHCLNFKICEIVPVRRYSKNEPKFLKVIACSCHSTHKSLLLKSKNDKFHTRGIDWGKLVSGFLKRSELRHNFILCSSSWVFSKSPSIYNYNTNLIGNTGIILFGLTEVEVLYRSLH